MSFQELMGVQIYWKPSKSQFLVHPTLPFIHLLPVYPLTPASCHTQCPGGVCWETTPDPPHKLTLKLSTNCRSLFVLCFHVFTALSSSSSNAKYDPDQIKVEIACRRERVSHYRRRTMGCSEGPFWLVKGAGVWPLQDTVALAQGLREDEDEIIIKGSGRG